MFEGADKVGKSTQVQMLEDRAKKNKIEVLVKRFPNRESPTGRILDQYLKKEIDLPPVVVVILFAANRWEEAAEIEAAMNRGVPVIVDRYAYSGVAYGEAHREPHMDWEWCKSLDKGLPKPDLLLYLKCNPLRGKHEEPLVQEEERFETVPYQTKVLDNFRHLWLECDSTNWQTINRKGRDADAIHKVMWKFFVKEIMRDKDDRIGKLWEDDEQETWCTTTDKTHGPVKWTADVKFFVDKIMRDKEERLRQWDDDEEPWFTDGLTAELEDPWFADRAEIVADDETDN